MPNREPTDELPRIIEDLKRHLAWQQAESGNVLLGVAGRVSAPASSMTKSPPAATSRTLAAPTPVSRAPSSPTANSYVRSVKDLPRVAKGNPAEAQTLDEIRREMGDCKRCGLCEGRKQIVFGSGNPRARLVFVGEGPGAEEDAEGVPFVGPAGQLLTKMIEAMGFTRDEVYICTIVKCRPPDNRAPEMDEVKACEPFVRAQLASLSPQVIVALGKTAAQTLLRDEISITKTRGEWQEYAGVPLMPTFHPSYLLRKPEEKKSVWADLQKVMKLLGKEPKRS